MSNEELVLMYREGNNDVLDLIIENNSGLVRRAAHKFYNRDPAIDIDDLVQEGNVGLIKAVKGYVINSDFAFSTYAYKCIWGTIHRFVLGKAYRQGYKDIKIVSLNTPVGEAENDIELGDTIASEENDYEMAENSIFEKTAVNELISILDDCSRKIVRLKYGIECTCLSSEQIANRYNISDKRVLQIVNTALRKMRNSYYGRKIREENTRYKREISYSTGMVTDSFINVIDREWKYTQIIEGTDLSLDVDLLASIYR